MSLVRCNVAETSNGILRRNTIKWEVYHVHTTRIHLHPESQTPSLVFQENRGQERGRGRSQPKTQHYRQLPTAVLFALSTKRASRTNMLSLTAT